MTRRRCGSIGLVAGVLLLAGPSIPMASSEELGAMGLDDAVRLTLARSPELARSRTDVARRDGSLREVRGTFDTTWKLSSSIEHAEGEISAQSENDELRRRLGLSILSKVFDGLRDGLARQIELKLLGRPVCPADLDEWSVEVDGQQYSKSTMCQPLEVGSERTDPAGSPEAYESYLDELFSSPVGASPADVLLFLSQLGDILGIDTEELASDTRQRALESVEQNYRLAVEVQSRAELSLFRLGEFPTREYQRSFAFSNSLIKPLRTGGSIELQTALKGIEDNFSDKPLDPKFGGKGVRTAFRSRVGLALSQPLWRGRGSASAAAAERSARENLVAAQEQYRHAVGQQVVAVCQAYFDLVAAQDTLALYEDTLANQRKVVEGTRVLLKAGEVARTELTRAAARQAELEATVAQARVSLLTAQTALAETIGIGGEVPGLGLTANQRLPDAPADLDIGALATGARARRGDLLAAEALRRASRHLFEGSRVDSRNKLDLSLTAGFSSDYFSPYFRVLKDESIRDVTEPRESPVDYFHPTGFRRSFSDRWQPYVTVKLTFELPIGNRRARGRLAQARATLARSAITATNVGRGVDQGILEQGAVLARSADELNRRREAAARHDENWKNAATLRAAGELNLIDTLTTEQQRTTARVELVRARRDYAATLAQYRFETGTLVGDAKGEPGGVDLNGLTGVR